MRLRHHAGHVQPVRTQLRLARQHCRLHARPVQRRPAWPAMRRRHRSSGVGRIREPRSERHVRALAAPVLQPLAAVPRGAVVVRQARVPIPGAEVALPRAAAAAAATAAAAGRVAVPALPVPDVHILGRVRRASAEHLGVGADVRADREAVGDRAVDPNHRPRLRPGPHARAALDRADPPERARRDHGVGDVTALRPNTC